MPDPAPNSSAMNIISLIASIIPAVAPEITLITAIVRAHQNASGGQFPTKDQVLAAYPVARSELQSIWDAYDQAKGPSNPSVPPVTAIHTNLG